VHAARIIAGHDDAAVRTGAALHTGIANKHGDGRASLQVPDLEGIVAGGGDRAPPVRRRRHAKDPIGMAGERAQVQMSLVSGSTLVSC
jgi:hydroxymethylglutaryl-CoA reductase